MTHSFAHGFNRRETIFLICIVVLSQFLVFNVSDALTDKISPGGIVIKSDGSIEGSDKIQRSGNVYTLTSDVNLKFDTYLTDNLTPFLVIERDNITVNGAGHTVTCNGTGVGIFARGVQGVTIANFTLKGFTVGVSTYTCDLVTQEFLELVYKTTHNNKIINNNIEVVNPPSIISGMQGWGIFVEFTEDTLVSGNTIKSADPAKGLYVGSTCNRTTINSNKFLGCGLDLYTLAEKTLSGNTIDGKPVVFVTGKSNQVIDGGEQVFAYNCNNITIRNVVPNNNHRRTIQLEATVNSVVTACSGIIALTDCTNNMVYGNNAKDIALFSSNFNKIHDNNLNVGYVIFPRASSEEIYGRCIDLSASKYNDIYNNTITNATYAIYLGEIEEASQYNNIYLNTIYNSVNGIYLAYSPQNYVYSNKIQNCTVGINLSATNNAVNVQNNITECTLAISIMGSNNQFYHNNIINNTNQVSISDQMLFSSSIVYASSVNNIFDNGYPSGGNYWSSFTGIDSNNDGISESPYVINSNSSDRYPFMHPVSLVDYTPPAKPAITYEPTPSPTVPPSTENPTANPIQTATPTLQPIETTPPQQETPTLVPTVTSNPEAPELQTLIIIPALVGLTLLLMAVGLKKKQGVPPKNP